MALPSLLMETTVKQDDPQPGAKPGAAPGNQATTAVPAPQPGSYRGIAGGLATGNVITVTELATAPVLGDSLSLCAAVGDVLQQESSL